MRIKRSGPEEAEFEERFRQLSPWLRRRLVSRGARGADAEDLVQETFLRWGRYGRDERSRHPKALLLRIASNLAIDVARSEAARGRGATVSLDECRDVRSIQADQDASFELKQAILSLPPAIRETFMLARFTPLSHAEIAARLGISVKTVEWRVARAVSICLARLER